MNPQPLKKLRLENRRTLPRKISWDLLRFSTFFVLFLVFSSVKASISCGLVKRRPFYYTLKLIRYMHKFCVANNVSTRSLHAFAVHSWKRKLTVLDVLNSTQMSLRIFATDFISSRWISLSEGDLQVLEQPHARENRSHVSRKVNWNFSDSDFFVFCVSGDNT